jgi:hypothetical protein
MPAWILRRSSRNKKGRLFSAAVLLPNREIIDPEKAWSSRRFSGLKKSTAEQRANHAPFSAQKQKRPEGFFRAQFLTRRV